MGQPYLPSKPCTTPEELLKYCDIPVGGSVHRNDPKLKRLDNELSKLKQQFSLNDECVKALQSLAIGMGGSAEEKNIMPANTEMMEAMLDLLAPKKR
jgi:hypothetical protein